MSTVPGLALRLVDDAAVFPPGNSSVESAVLAHYRYLDGPHEEILGPLLIPASRIEEARRAAEPTRQLPIALIADGGLAELVAARQALQDDSWIELAHVEMRLPTVGSPPAAMEQLLLDLAFTVPAYIELPQGVDPGPALAVIGGDGAERAKFRCGPDEVPSSNDLARFLSCCVSHNVPFKLTAGLHHALPFQEGDGPTQHGFVNTLAATWAAIDGAQVPALVELLNARRPEVLTDVLAAADVETLRRFYRSFGSCSIEEPYEELQRLALVDNDES